MPCRLKTECKYPIDIYTHLMAQGRYEKDVFLPRCGCLIIDAKIDYKTNINTCTNHSFFYTIVNLFPFINI